MLRTSHELVQSSPAVVNWLDVTGCALHKATGRGSKGRRGDIQLHFLIKPGGGAVF